MKAAICALFLSCGIAFSFAQCDMTSVSVSFSDTDMVQLYHPGFFLIPSGEDNVCDWTVQDFSGQVIHSDSTTGAAFEQGRILFNHMVPITDSMEVNLVITNATEGITCTIQDILFWEEIEVLPGSFIGNWAILSNNVGTQDSIVSGVDSKSLQSEITLYPSPAADFFFVKGIQGQQNLRILNASGLVVMEEEMVSEHQMIDSSTLPKGLYIVEISTARGNRQAFKLLKQ